MAKCWRKSFSYPALYIVSAADVNKPQTASLCSPSQRTLYVNRSSGSKEGGGSTGGTAAYYKENVAERDLGCAHRDYGIAQKSGRNPTCRFIARSRWYHIQCIYRDSDTLPIGLTMCTRTGSIPYGRLREADGLRSTMSTTVEKHTVTRKRLSKMT